MPFDQGGMFLIPRRGGWRAGDEREREEGEEKERGEE